jgi:hypothetical protein
MPWRQKDSISAPTTKQRSRSSQPQRKPAQTGPTPPSEPGPRPRGKQKGGKSDKGKPRKLSHLKQPPGMSLEDWQRELRRQFGREQNYRLKNIGEHPIVSGTLRASSRVLLVDILLVLFSFGLAR